MLQLRAAVINGNLREQLFYEPSTFKNASGLAVPVDAAAAQRSAEPQLI